MNNVDRGRPMEGGCGGEAPNESGHDDGGLLLSNVTAGAGLCCL